MTATTWERQRGVSEALHTIVSDPNLGVEALSSAHLLSNLLKDLLPDAPRETSVLVAAAEAGLAQMLLERVRQGMHIDTAAALTASAFAARTPFTADACHWVVGELSVALGLMPGETAQAITDPVGGAQPQGAGGAARPGLPPVMQPRVSDAAETVLPQAANVSAGTAWRPPGEGVTATGAGVPAGPGQGQAPKRSRTRRTWMILTSAIATAAVIGAAMAAAPRLTGTTATPPPTQPAPAQPAPTQPAPTPTPTPSRAGFEPLSQIIAPFTTSCKPGDRRLFPGIVHIEYCAANSGGITVVALQFDNSADYSTAISRNNTAFSFNPSTAANTCPPPAGSTEGLTSWYSSNYPKRRGQFLECYTTKPPAPATYLWTVPTSNVMLLAFAGTYAHLDRWWTHTSIG